MTANTRRRKPSGRKAPPFALAFSGNLTVIEADDVCARLLSALAAHDAVAVDCAAAGEIDLTFVQCLIAARRSAAAAGKSLTLAAPASGALREVLQRGGLLDAAGERPFWTRE